MIYKCLSLCRQNQEKEGRKRKQVLIEAALDFLIFFLTLEKKRKKKTSRKKKNEVES